MTNAIYRIITDQELRGPAAGRLTREMTRRILGDYESYHRDLILNLLKRFELAYPARDDIWYLPGALPQDEPPSASGPAWSDALTFEYEYPELPESVITRFIVRAHEWIEDNQVWRRGAILAQGGNRALVRADPASRRVEIRVGGDERTRRDLLAVIRSHFQAIHKTFTESAGKEAFPVQSFLCPPQYPGLRLNYEDLLTYERDDLREIPATWQGRTIRLNVTAVLNGFTTPEARRQERERLFLEERMPREIHYHEHRHFEADVVSGSVVNLGNDNLIQQVSRTLSPEIERTLQELTAAVNAMLEHLSGEQAEEVREDLKRLQEELQKPKPSRKWYSISIEGLRQAATNLDQIGKPVIELAGKLLELLGKLS